MVDVVPDDALGLLQPRLERGRARDRAPARARPPGRAPRGVSARRPRRSLRSASSRGTTPIPEYMKAPIDGAVNVMEAPFFDPEHYRSDSNQAWRHGCPHEQLAARRVRVAAAADASGDLGVRRRDDARVDGVDARRRPRGAARAPAPRPHRPRRERVGTLHAREAAHRHGHRVRRARHGGAAAGAARERRARGAARRHRHERALRRAPPLRRVPHRPRRRRPRVPGRDPARSPSRRASTRSCRSPRSTSKGWRSTSAASRCRCSSRSRTRSAARTTRRRRTRCCTGSASRRRSSSASTARARSPRPPRSSATPIVPSASSRCSRPGRAASAILDPTVDRAHQLLNERPGSVAMRLDEAVELLPDEGGPDLLVMELATGGEVTIDGIANGREIVLGHPKTREAMRAGLAMYFVTLDDPELMRVGEHDRRGPRDRALLQHPARRRLRDRDQPAHLDDRLPGGPEHPVPRRQARDRRDLGGRAAHVRVAHPPGPHGAALLRPARVRLMLGPTSRRPRDSSPAT